MFFWQKEKKEEKEIGEYVGAKCRVMTQDNQMLFVGVVQHYDPQKGKLIVGLQMGTCSYTNLPYDAGMKIEILSNHHSDAVVLLYAKVKRYGMDEWTLEIDQVMSHKDQRENFRLRVSNNGFICDEDSVPRYRCHLVDISLTGALISCAEKFEVNQRFILNCEPLRPGGAPYTLTCRVRRIIDTTPYSYGCEFIGVTAKQEQQLYQDIFALQSKMLQTMQRVNENG